MKVMLGLIKDVPTVTSFPPHIGQAGTLYKVLKYDDLPLDVNAGLESVTDFIISNKVFSHQVSVINTVDTSHEDMIVSI